MASAIDMPNGIHREPDTRAVWCGAAAGRRAPLRPMMDGLTHTLSRLPVRLLAFNVLLVFLPAAGILFLGTYEDHLLEAQERTMAQEGRLLAAAIEASGDVDADHARRILVQLGQRHLARLRVVDRAGEVLADSATLGPRRESDPDRSTGTISATGPQESVLYRIGSLPVRIDSEAARW